MARGRWPLYYSLFAIFVAVLVIALVAPSPWSGIAFGFTRKSIDETRDELIASAPQEKKSDTPPSDGHA